MDLDRFKQFKCDSDVLIESSNWLDAEINKIIQEEHYYQDNPHLDTYNKMISRFNRMDELEARSKLEDNYNKSHRLKYKDIYDDYGYDK